MEYSTESVCNVQKSTSANWIDKEIIVDETQITFVIGHIDFAKFYAEIDLNSDQGFTKKQLATAACKCFSFVYSFKEEFGIDESHGPDPDGYELHNEYELFRYQFML